MKKKKYVFRKKKFISDMIRVHLNSFESDGDLRSLNYNIREYLNENSHQWFDLCDGDEVILNDENTHYFGYIPREDIKCKGLMFSSKGVSVYKEWCEEMSQDES